MRTHPDCLPCFIRQTEFTSRLACESPARQAEIMDEASKLVTTFDRNLSPPENAVFLYRLISGISGNPDIFKDQKEQDNKKALAMLPFLEKTVARATAPLATAIRLSIAGNIIDYGSHQDFDVNEVIKASLSHPLGIDHTTELRKDMAEAEKILYLADNCGELVFDGLLLRQMLGSVTIAVKESPIINDALHPDAVACGLDKLARVISNGTDCPGTPLKSCSEEFRQEFNRADLVISKGQGNFETLSETPGPIYFLMTLKCPVVAEHAALLAGLPDNSLQPGDMVVLKKP